MLLIGTSSCNCQIITETYTPSNAPLNECALQQRYNVIGWYCAEYMHVLIFVATGIHIWYCCNISIVFTTAIRQLKRVEAI